VARTAAARGAADAGPAPSAPEDEEADWSTIASRTITGMTGAPEPGRTFRQVVRRKGWAGSGRDQTMTKAPGHRPGARRPAGKAQAQLCLAIRLGSTGASSPSNTRCPASKGAAREA